jgi:hypothetical protein
VSLSLVVRIREVASFAEILERSSVTLMRLLNLESVPKLIYELPPAKKNLSLEGQLIDANFPGAYISLQNIERSMASFLVFNSPAPGEKDRLLLSCGADGRGPASEVLVVSLAAAASELVSGSIDDAGHHWLDKDEYGPEELVEGLRLLERPTDFHVAVELVHRRQAVHERHQAR